ncbi:MAG: Dabb family protein [Candidatus Sericytochromatia bacterium]|nr:Dabb family protein [Candidatus Sericytochromatia bacterium]
MLKHLVLFQIEGQTEAQETAMIAAFEGLVDTIPELHSLRMGRNVSPRDTTYSHALVSEHDDLDGCLAYVNHPAHQAAIAAHLAPYMKARAIVDFTTPA